jgi:hypothetical protein
MLKHQLIERYAMRAREFSDAVALLGRHKHITQEFVGLVREIKRLRELCDEAAAEVDRHISQTAASAVSRSSNSSANKMTEASERDALTKTSTKLEAGIWSPRELF